MPSFCTNSTTHCVNIFLLIGVTFRPLAGRVNYCPGQFASRSDKINIDVAIHEIYHALVNSVPKTKKPIATCIIWYRPGCKVLDVQLY